MAGLSTRYFWNHQMEYLVCVLLASYVFQPEEEYAKMITAPPTSHIVTASPRSDLYSILFLLASYYSQGLLIKSYINTIKGCVSYLRGILGPSCLAWHSWQCLFFLCSPSLIIQSEVESPKGGPVGFKSPSTDQDKKSPLKEWKRAFSSLIRGHRFALNRQINIWFKKSRQKKLC